MPDERGSTWALVEAIFLPWVSRKREAKKDNAISRRICILCNEKERLQQESRLLVNVVEDMLCEQRGPQRPKHGVAK